jgi:hypothetical protein
MCKYERQCRGLVLSVGAEVASLPRVACDYKILQTALQWRESCWRGVRRAGRVVARGWVLQAQSVMRGM